MLATKERDWFKCFVLGFKNYWLFIPAFIIMAVYLKIHGSMISYSGDASSIWSTITSFYSGDIVPSYVLYKGFASVYPYVWLYQLSKLLGVGQFFFVKLFHCTLFAYVSAIGFPYLIENLLNVQPKIWRRALLIIVMFWLWVPNYALCQVMVDLPSLTYFILLLNAAYKVGKGDLKYPVIRYIYTGLLLGINVCMSGQYMPAAACILIFIMIKTIPLKKIRIRDSRWEAIGLFILLVACMVFVKCINIYFELTITDVLRSQGGWIPTSSTWLGLTLIHLDDLRRFFGPGLPDYRGLAIINDYYGDQSQSIISAFSVNGYSITITQYIKLCLQYPVDFLTRYFNRVFLALSPDGGYLSISRLFVSYTLLFSAFLALKKRVTSVRKFFSSKMLILLSFLFSLAAMMVTAIEYRYTMQIQGLVFSLALLDNTLWDGFRSLYKTILQCFKNRSLRSLGEQPFPYHFLVYILFILFCFTHMATLYETLGPDTTYILFRF